MSISYQAKQSLVLAQQLVVQEVVIPFTITANATPASKSSTVDAPSILFLNLNGTGQNNVTSSSGALASGETLPTTYNGGTSLPATSDASGIFYAFINIGEFVTKVVSASFTSRVVATASATFGVTGLIPDAISSNTVTLPNNTVVATPQGVSSKGQGIYVCFDSSSFNLATTNVDGVITCRYEVFE